MRGSVCGFLLLYMSQIQAAPKGSPDKSLHMLDDASLTSISNPFGFGEDEVRMLQNYLKSIKEVQGDPEKMTREQVLLYLFAYYDCDKSGHLDGLDLLKLVYDFWSQQLLSQSSSEMVVRFVDEVLETQDLNGDGLLNPSELLAPPSDLHISKRDGEIQQQGIPLVIEPPHGALVKEEEAQGLSLEPPKETTIVGESLQGQEEPQVAGDAPFNQQGSDILENPEKNANDPEGIPQNLPMKRDEAPVPQEISNTDIEMIINEDIIEISMLEEEM